MPEAEVSPGFASRCAAVVCGGRRQSTSGARRRNKGTRLSQSTTSGPSRQVSREFPKILLSACPSPGGHLSCGMCIWTTYWMLRIITRQRANSWRLELHGRVADEWIAVLEEHWRSTMEQAPAARVTVSVSNVDFIDPDGERLLRQMAESGVKFAGAGAMNRYVLAKFASGIGWRSSSRRSRD